MELGKHVKIYSTGLIDVNGEFTVADVKAIESKLQAGLLNKNRRELNICLDCTDINDTTVQELINFLERNSTLKTIFVDVTHDFKELITLHKNTNGQVEKRYKQHGLYFTDFPTSERNNFYVNLFRSASPRFQNLSMPRDVHIQTYVVDRDGHWRLEKVIIRTRPALVSLSQALEDHTVTSLKKIGVNDNVTDDFWRALQHNTHVTKVKCNIEQLFRETRETFNATMRHNKTLQALKVSWKHDIHDEFESWFAGLADNTTIKRLHVQVNAPTTIFLTQFAEYLSYNTSLTHLRVKFSNLESIEAPKVVYNCLHESHIHHLTLHYSAYHVPDLIDFITHNKSIVALDLIGPPIESASAQLVLDALQQNETLTQYNHRLSSKFKNPLQSIDYDIGHVVRKNRKKREEYINDMTVLLFNIARSALLLSVPKDIWLHIFSNVSLARFEYKFRDLLATLFQNSHIRKIVSCPYL